jgi:multidrug transporter EmrE-like cation transporter
MKIAAIILSLCLAQPEPNLAEPRLKADEVVGDLSGIYSVTGTDGDKEYNGTCLVVKAGEGYVFLWSTISQIEGGLGFATMKGTGLRKNDMVSVSWGNEKANGITVFTVLANGRLRGEWTQSAALGRKDVETLTKVAAIPGGFN